MNATIIPFPLAKRRQMIVRQARYAAVLSADAAERHIAHQLRLQADAMRRKGIESHLIEGELKSMEMAIRKLLACAVFGGAA
ncbi:MAG: hypothetical protein KGM47_06495 [Acidobacteriota bacterium]|nr:hypothetical protein [Acidobacteriota bacterium]